MKIFHTTHKTDSYYLYHWFYTGFAAGWDPCDLRWGYVGIAPYPEIPERYRIESKECATGQRKRKRTVIRMLDLFQPKNQIGFRIIGQNLTSLEALRFESFLRPEGHVFKKDNRIWNEVAGG